MHNVAGIVAKLRRAGLQLSLDGDEILCGPQERLTDELRATIREHRHQLLDCLRDLQEARNEREALLEVDHGFSREQARREAARRIQFVTCESCAHWTGKSPCQAGLYVSDGPRPDLAIRICGFHTPREAEQ